MIITIGREYGSGGHEVGKSLAELYQIPFLDKDALLQEAKQKGVYEENLSFYEEKSVNSLLYAIAADSYPKHIGKTQFDFMKSLVGNKGCVIIGRCGNYIFKDTPDAVSVFLHANVDYRIQRVRDIYGIEGKNFQSIIMKTDQQRGSFHKFYTDQEWGDSRNYHLAINSGQIGVDGCIELITAFIDKKKRNVCMYE